VRERDYDIHCPGDDDHNPVRHYKHVGHHHYDPGDP
jgi:hypothetical protein